MKKYVEKNNLKKIKELLKIENYDKNSIQNHMLIKIAAEKNYLEMTQLLTTVFDPSINYNIAIGEAAKYGCYETVEFLLKDSRVDPSDDFNYAISCAIRSGHIKVFNLLIKNERILNSNLNTAFVNACKIGDVDIVNSLLKTNKVNLTFDNNSPIYNAFQYKRYDIIKLLYEYKDVKESLKEDNGLLNSINSFLLNNKINKF
jgi:ankyrin repeat protein